jgi:hypothetical protein
LPEEPWILFRVRSDGTNWNSLFWIVGRVCKYPWIDPAPNTVVTCNNNSIFHGVQEVIVKDVLPDSLNELTPTVSHELAALGVPVWVPP